MTSYSTRHHDVFQWRSQLGQITAHVGIIWTSSQGHLTDGFVVTSNRPDYGQCGWWKRRLDDVLKWRPNHPHIGRDLALSWTSPKDVIITFITRPDHGPWGDDLDVITRTSYGRLSGDLKQPLLRPVWVMKKPLKWRPNHPLSGRDLALSWTSP